LIIAKQLLQKNFVDMMQVADMMQLPGNRQSFQGNVAANIHLHLNPLWLPVCVVPGHDGPTCPESSTISFRHAFLAFSIDVCTNLSNNEYRGPPIYKQI